MTTAHKSFQALRIRLALILLLVVVLSFSIFFLIKNFAPPSQQTISIELRDNGFYPENIIIKLGDTITFSTNRDAEFWPASDLHPTHTLYSEFDPKQPIPSNETWSFTFNNPGTWKFHDHLSSIDTGTIVVEASDESMITDNHTDICNEKQLEQKAYCWSQALEEAVANESVDGSYQIFTQFYNNEPDFAENCHGYTHIIGEAAYELFLAGKPMKLTDKIAYCSYGFFHGFMEAMLYAEGDLRQASEFCNAAENELSGTLYVLGPCFHGIGHGVTDASDPRDLGDEQALVEEPLRLCTQAGATSYETKMCATGVFNALAAMYFSPELYEITLDPLDPYAFCRKVEDSIFREACYEDFKILPMHIEKNDFSKAIRYVEPIEEDRYAFAAIDTISSFNVYYLLRDNILIDNAVHSCYTLQERLWGPCIAGLGAGLMGQGTPEEEYIQALTLCGSSVVKDPEKDVCYKRVVPLIPLRYSTEKSEEICRTLHVPYNKICLGGIRRQ